MKTSKGLDKIFAVIVSVLQKSMIKTVLSIFVDKENEG